MSDDQYSRPVEVTVKNWNEAPKPDHARRPRKTIRTITQTYALDAGDPNKRTVQIAGFEPNRIRMVVQVIDHECYIYNTMPTTFPDAATPLTASQGRYLPTVGVNASYEYIFYGNDAWWLNAIGGQNTRVTVTKEYENTEGEN